MDEKTNNTLDALAELFLTEDQPGGDALSGPAPIKMRPKAAQVARPSSMNEPPDPTLGELDELTQELLGDAAALLASYQDTDHTASDYQQPPADTPAHDEDGPKLRLAGGEDDSESSDRSSGRPQPIIGVAEAVVLGNLPGMAGPWLTQYGQLLAQQDGAVAILHVDTDSIDLEVIEPTQHDASNDPAAAAFRGPSLRVPPGGFAGRDMIAVLEQLCRSRVLPVRTILLHMDPTPEALPRLLDLDYWTLLSGADDAAIVAGYRLLKSLIESDDEAARAHVGLMVVGSDKDAGQKAAKKLRSAVANFLHTPVELIGYQQKMIPARCRTLGTFTELQTLWPRLIDWLSKLEAPTVDPATDVQPERAPVVSAIDTFESAEDVSAASEATHATLPPLDEPVEVQATPEPKPSSDTPAWELTPEPTDAQEIDLFSLIDSDARAAASIPGGLALEARCPSQPHTQLALDSIGRLHLLHRHDSAEGDPPTPKEAIVELVAVRDWARQHRQLLQLTERGRRFDPDADPVLHLFTDRADLSVNLVARLGDLLKLHLLRDVAVGDERTFFCTPLSA
ncbi:hypothetical protein [Algisphaera agarilytica]|uniref:Uncharacterized protein n=1 Tax=Algisphaera agarilytica TaxID=1385975 RepID=A0A7X0LL69_9BACT|nr:hypothetical protein [Algisphaera agarilytica]MBB6429678.1 hypothetical protein [Algisphaera agarilytica]